LPSLVGLPENTTGMSGPTFELFPTHVHASSEPFRFEPTS
jgi:hypothetical protein